MDSMIYTSYFLSHAAECLNRKNSTVSFIRVLYKSYSVCSVTPILPVSSHRHRKFRSLSTRSSFPYRLTFSHSSSGSFSFFSPVLYFISPNMLCQVIQCYQHSKAAEKTKTKAKRACERTYVQVIMAPLKNSPECKLLLLFVISHFFTNHSSHPLDPHIA